MKNFDLDLQNEMEQDFPDCEIVVFESEDYQKYVDIIGRYLNKCEYILDEKEKSQAKNFAFESINRVKIYEKSFRKFAKYSASTDCYFVPLSMSYKDALYDVLCTELFGRLYMDEVNLSMNFPKDFVNKKRVD